MDEFDRKILAALFKDSSQPYTAIGKAVRLSRENVQYRMQRLEKEGVVRSYVTLIDHRRLGFQLYTIAIQFEGAAFAKEKELIEALARNPNFSWIGPTAGKWSVAVDAYVKDREEFEKIFQSFLSEHGQYIAAYDVLHTEHAISWFWKQITPPVKQVPVKGRAYVPDTIDKKLLRLLADNSRAAYTELAKATKLTPNACKYRIRALERSGIIQGYTLNINHDRLGYQWYTIRLRADRADPKLSNKLLAFCENHPNILFYYKYFRSGSIDFDIGFIVKNQSELREGLTELRHQLAGQLRVDDIFISFEQVSSHSLPPAVFR